jgi:hypothetical protein
MITPNGLFGRAVAADSPSIAIPASPVPMTVDILGAVWPMHGADVKAVAVARNVLRLTLIFMTLCLCIEAGLVMLVPGPK